MPNTINVTSEEKNCYKEKVNNYNYIIDCTYKNNLLETKHQSNTVANDGVSSTEKYIYNAINSSIELNIYNNNILDRKEIKIYDGSLLMQHNFFDQDENKTKVITYTYDENKNITSEIIKL
ncbi:hypothetical protein [Algibacter sp. L1A34]|uniref:hypothetical protein n=1 Tax=Algibacter sp. L1A34 TaxID=2686365 RepID=UPI00131CC71A|nr:hypothetical protein [Algibacter sp. L1A34]